MNKIIPTCLFLVLACPACRAQSDINSKDIRGEVVYQDDNVVFRKIDDHTWIGNGHLCYNESLYIIEGEKKSMSSMKYTSMQLTWPRTCAST